MAIGQTKTHEGGMTGKTRRPSYTQTPAIATSFVSVSCDHRIVILLTSYRSVFVYKVLFLGQTQLLMFKIRVVSSDNQTSRFAAHSALLQIRFLCHGATGRRMGSCCSGWSLGNRMVPDQSRGSGALPGEFAVALQSRPG